MESYGKETLKTLWANTTNAILWSQVWQNSLQKLQMSSCAGNNPITGVHAKPEIERDAC